MTLQTLLPDGWKAPIGYANGIVAPAGARIVFVAGQVGWNAQQIFESEELAPQFEQALRNVVEVLRCAGAKPEHIVRMTVYVTDKQMYVAHARRIGVTWKDLVGRHYPAMTLVEVADLLEEGALVELEATAAIG